MKYRESNIGEIEQLKVMGKLLWSESSSEKLDNAFRETFDESNKTTVVGLAGTGELVGFATFSLRSDVEGATSSPSGYLEGIFVYPGYRKQEVGKHLLALGEKWSVDQGCTQMGSDTSITDTDSTGFHKHVGFRVTEKSTCFIKDLK